MTPRLPVFYGDLLPSERRLVAAIHRHRFGHFARLRIENGEVVLHPWPITVREIKFAEKVLNEVQNRADHSKLPKQVVELLGHIRSVESGEIRTLEFRHALPFRMDIETPGELEAAGGWR
jgi:hypothetical protein